MSSRKIIIPKGLVENPNQNSTIEVSSRLNQTTGNLIAKRQGKKLVAQQLPEWQDSLSSPEESVGENSFFATPAGCQPPPKPSFTARPNETFQSANGRTRDTTFYSATSSNDDYQSALSHDPNATYTQSCYKTPFAESSPGAYLDYTGNDATMNPTIESSIQMANVVNDTRTGPGSTSARRRSRLGDVRQRLFTSGSSGSPNEQKSSNFTRDSSMNQTFAAPNQQRNPNSVTFTRAQPQQNFSSSRDSSGSREGFPQSYTENVQAPCTRPRPPAGVRRRLFDSADDQSPGQTFTKPANQTFDVSKSRGCACADIPPSPGQYDSFQPGVASSPHRPNQTFDWSPGRGCACAENAPSFGQYDSFQPGVARSPQTFQRPPPKSRGCACTEPPPSPGQYNSFQPGVASSPQRANQTFDVSNSLGQYESFQPGVASSPHRANRTFQRPPPPNRTFVRPGSGRGAPCNNRTFARPNLQQTYDADASFSTLEESGAYVPSARQTVPGARPRTGRPRPGQDTYPRSFNRSTFEDGTDSGAYWPDSDFEPGRPGGETITDYPTDESYAMRFHPILSSTQRSLSELEDSSEDMMYGFGPVNRSDDGKYNIITPMTPSPQKPQAKDCSCSSEGSES